MTPEETNNSERERVTSFSLPKYFRRFFLTEHTEITEKRINTSVNSVPSVRDPSFTFTQHVKQIFIKGWFSGLGIAAGLATAGLLAVAVTGTFNTFASGGVMKAADINANFASLKAAIEGIPTEKAMRLIYETDIESATSNVNITGLNGNTDLTYEIIVKVMGTPGSTNIYLRLNNDSLSTNYGYKQMNFFNCTGVSTGSNDAEGGILIAQIATANITQSKITLFAKSGVNRAFNIIFGSFSGGCNYGIGYNYAWWNNSASNITSIQIQSVLANGIGAGSHIEVWARR